MAFLQGAFSTLQGPAESATSSLLVPERHRARANAIRELSFPLASVLAPVLAGLIYVVVGVSGVLAVDLFTFLVTANVLLVLTIPQPAATTQGSAGRGHLLGAWRSCLGFLRRRNLLLVLIIYVAFTNLMLNGPLDLAIPYFISARRSQTQVGIGLTMMSLGAFAGALLITGQSPWFSRPFLQTTAARPRAAVYPGRRRAADLQHIRLGSRSGPAGGFSRAALAAGSLFPV